MYFQQVLILTLSYFKRTAFFLGLFVPPSSTCASERTFYVYLPFLSLILPEGRGGRLTARNGLDATSMALVLQGRV
jgi:hypothetical protein